MRSTRITVVGVGVSLALLLVLGTANAEVGAIYEPGRVDMAAGFVQTVVDEPDPFGYWVRIGHPDSVRRRLLNIDGDDRGDGPPAMIQDASWDGPIVLWSKNLTNSGHKIVISRFVGGAWETPERINADDGEQFDPALALAPNGTLHVVYWQANDGVWDIRHQALANAGDAWTLPVVISAPGDVSCRPSVAIHNGLLAVVYEVHPNGAGTDPKEVTLAERPDEDTSDFVSEMITSTALDGRLRPRIHSQNGKLWIDWIDSTAVDDAYDGEMAWVKRTK